MSYGRLEQKILTLFVETRSGCNCARIALGQGLVSAVAEFSSLKFLIAAMIAEVSLLCKKLG
jgi:hypothetical protein